MVEAPWCPPGLVIKSHYGLQIETCLPIFLRYPGSLLHGDKHGETQDEKHPKKRRKMPDQIDDQTAFLEAITIYELRGEWYLFSRPFRSRKEVVFQWVADCIRRFSPLTSVAAAQRPQQTSNRALSTLQLSSQRASPWCGHDHQTSGQFQATSET